MKWGILIALLSSVAIGYYGIFKWGKTTKEVENVKAENKVVKAQRDIANSNDLSPDELLSLMFDDKL